jgi:diadenosine tetraphosphate (Ap4A) HIT family hydrolase
LYLWNNEAYRGACTLIYDLGHATRPSELAPANWQRLCEDLRMAEAAISAVLAPDHVNVALMGNSVPHLQWWIVPRRTSDPRWGRPIWTTTGQDFASGTMAADACEALADELRAWLGSAGVPVAGAHMR